MPDGPKRYPMPALLRNSAPAACHAPQAAPPTGFVARLLTALALHRQQQALLTRDAALPRDIGLTRAQALAEAGRPLWDAPATRRR